MFCLLSFEYTWKDYMILINFIREVIHLFINS